MRTLTGSRCVVNVAAGIIALAMGATVSLGQQLPADSELAWPVRSTSVLPVAYTQADSGGIPPGTLPYPSTTTDLPPAQVPEGVPLFTGPGEPLPSTPGAVDSAATSTSPATVPIPETNASWLSPWEWQPWFVASEWDGSFEMGINGTEGNADSMSFRTGGNLKRKVNQWEFTTDIVYAKTVANGNETQHNAVLNAGYEWFFGPDSPWSHFGKTNLEYDEFKAFDLRLAINAGLGYQFWKSDITSLKGRFGAGSSHEINGPDSRWVAEAVFGADYTHQWSKRQKLNLTTDYFPEWDDFKNYRLVTSLGWEFLLDDTSNLSLKLSVNDRYDSTPNGRKPNDVIYSLLLLWKI